MIVHSNKKRIPSLPKVEEERKNEEVKVNIEKSIKKNKKIKEEEVILPLVEDDFSLIEEEYNS